MNAVLCPVCTGRGFVSTVFYSQMSVSSTTNGIEKCRSCGGKGYLLIPDAGLTPKNCEKCDEIDRSALYDE